MSIELFQDNRGISHFWAKNSQPSSQTVNQSLLKLLNEQKTQTVAQSRQSTVKQFVKQLNSQKVKQSHQNGFKTIGVFLIFWANYVSIQQNPKNFENRLSTPGTCAINLL